MRVKKELNFMLYEIFEKHILRLEHDLYFLMDFISENGLWQEAKDYLEEHEDDAIPFGLGSIQ